MHRPFDLSVYLVTDPVLNGGRPVWDVVEAALAGGVTIVQLRDPLAKGREMVETARRLQTILKSRGIPLIINDRVDVALAVDADGVHVGQKDIDARDARRMIGPEKILGLSVLDRRELQASADVLDVVDYLGVGPVFSTTTKIDAAAAAGLAALAEVCALSPLPTVAIGGIDASRARGTIAAGADGVAVVSAIMMADDPAKAAAEIAGAVKEGRVI
jgi:thiamine-phosphate pyrophosphorylase